MIEAHRAGAIRARGITGDGQAADALTKPLPRSRFVMLRDFFMNIVNRVRQRGHGSSEDSGVMTAGIAPPSSVETENAKNASLATRTCTSTRKV